MGGWSFTAPSLSPQVSHLPGLAAWWCLQCVRTDMLHISKFPNAQKLHWDEMSLGRGDRISWLSFTDRWLHAGPHLHPSQRVRRHNSCPVSWVRYVEAEEVDSIAASYAFRNVVPNLMGPKKAMLASRSGRRLWR